MLVDLLDRLEKVEYLPTRPGHTMDGKARCPAHDDRTPSLSWGICDGRLLMRCFAGCSFAMIAAAMGLKMGDFFETKVDGGSIAKPTAVVDTVYQYHDERGDVLYEVVRMRPKGFRQRMPDRKYADGYRWSVPPEVRRVLYRLPRLLAEPARQVVVVEGEKDVQTLERLGFLATTNAGGAHSAEGGSVGKWRKEYSETLYGRDVVIIPDRDEPGERHAMFVAGSLLYHGARSIRIVRLPFRDGSGKDASDFVAQGGNFQEITDAIKMSPEWNWR